MLVPVPQFLYCSNMMNNIIVIMEIKAMLGITQRLCDRMLEVKSKVVNFEL